MWVPDAAHEALRDVVRAREAAKKDQLRARHRLGKFLLRHGRRPPTGTNRWTQRYLLWVKGVRFAEAAHEATLLDYLHEVEHRADRLTRLEAALDAAVQAAPAPMRAVIAALQALRGVAQVSAATIVAELGQVSRFSRKRGPFSTTQVWTHTTRPHLLAKPPGGRFRTSAHSPSASC